MLLPQPFDAAQFDRQAFVDQQRQDAGTRPVEPAQSKPQQDQVFNRNWRDTWDGVYGGQ